jgi:hypothetical protein
LIIKLDFDDYCDFLFTLKEKNYKINLDPNIVFLKIKRDFKNKINCDDFTVKANFIKNKIYMNYWEGRSFPLFLGVVDFADLKNHNIKIIVKLRIGVTLFAILTITALFIIVSVDSIGAVDSVIFFEFFKSQFIILSILVIFCFSFYFQYKKINRIIKEFISTYENIFGKIEGI